MEIRRHIKLNSANPFIGRLWGDYSIALFRCYVSFNNNGADYYGGHLGNMDYRENVEHMLTLLKQ